MALLASLFAIVGRFVGRIVSTALNWASVLLFGRVPGNRQTLLGAITIGSLVWVVTLLGVLLPRVGAVLLTAVPAPDWVRSEWIRLAMLAAAAILPLLIGAGSRFLVEAAERPGGPAMVKGVLRGYPLALVLSVVLVFVSVLAVMRRGRTILLRWSEAHIPLVVMPGGYDDVVADLEAALDAAGVPVERTDAPLVLELPTRLVALVAGPGVRSLVPDRLQLLRGQGLEVLVYPSDVAIGGSREQVARARAATATRLTFSRAYLTSHPDTQAVEDLLAGIEGAREPSGAGAAAPGQTAPRRSGRPASPPAALSERDRRILDQVDERLATIQAPYEEWEVLYRVRLQVERDALRGALARDRAARSRPRPAAHVRVVRSGFASRAVSVAALAFALALAALAALDAAMTLLGELPRRRR